MGGRKGSDRGKEGGRKDRREGARKEGKEGRKGGREGRRKEGKYQGCVTHVGCP